MNKLSAKILEFRKHGFEKDTYLGISLYQQLEIALDRFYSIHTSFDGKTDYHYKSIAFYKDNYPFDPYHKELVASYEESYHPWSNDIVGMERIKEYGEYVLNTYKHSKLTSKPFKFEEDPLEARNVFSFSFIVTRELVTHKAIIIGFYNIATGQYRRYFIRNIKKFCRGIRTQTIEFNSLFGIPKYNNQLPYIRRNGEKYLKMVKDASHIPICDENVKILIDTLTQKNCKIISLR